MTPNRRWWLFAFGFFVMLSWIAHEVCIAVPGFQPTYTDWGLSNALACLTGVAFWAARTRSRSSERLKTWHLVCFELALLLMWFACWAITVVPSGDGEQWIAGCVLAFAAGAVLGTLIGRQMPTTETAQTL